MVDPTPVSWHQLKSTPRKQAIWAEDDLGYDWVIRAWTSLFHNIVDIVGIIHDPDDIIGIVKDTEELQGSIGKGTL